MSLYSRSIQAKTRLTRHNIDVKNAPFKIITANYNLGILAVHFYREGCGLPMLDLVGNRPAHVTFFPFKGKLVAK